MPARNVIRPGIPGRVSNPYYNLPNTAPGAQAAAAASAYYKTTTTASPAPIPSTGLEGHIVSNGVSDVSTPYGTVSLLFANGVPSIKNNVVFAVPQTQTQTSSLGTLSTKGTVLYTYQLSNNQLVPTPYSAQGGIYYQSPYMQSEVQKAQGAYAAAQSQVSLYNQITQKIIPGLSASANKATNPQVAQMYGTLIQSYNTEANQLLSAPVYSKGQFAGYSARALEGYAQSVIQQNSPVMIAKLTPSGPQVLNTTVADTIYGTVNGKAQNLGSLMFKPTQSGGTVSLAYAGFNPSVVQVSGQGWYAGINTSYNPSTGLISINPKNFAYVTGNQQTSTLSNGEVVQSITMPSGFGLSQSFPQGLGYLSATNIPVTAPGGYTAKESYLQQGNAPGVYSLTWGGNFPISISNSVSLGSGVTEISKAVRQFNSATGGISYSSQTYFDIPGVGNAAITNPTTTSYTYAGKNYTFSFTPSTNTYSISGAVQQPTNGAVALYNRVVGLKMKLSGSSSSSQSIHYLFGPQGGVTGYEIYNAQGNFVSGGSYLTPKLVAGANVTQATMVGNTLVLPMSEYKTYLAQTQASTTQLNANNLVSSENQQVTNIFGNNDFSKFVVGQWDPFYQMYQAGTLYSHGYTSSAISEATTSVETGVAYAGVAAGGYTLLTGGGLAAFGTTSAAVLGTRAATGSGISIGLGEAASYVTTGKPMNVNQTIVSGVLGATTGVALGGVGITGEQTIPQAAGATIYNVGKYAVEPMAIFSGVTAAAVGALDPSVWLSVVPGSSSGNTKSLSQLSQSQSGISKVATPTSPILSMAGEYLSFVGTSTLSGAEFGAEFGGAFAGVGALAGAAVKAVNPDAYDFIRANPTISKLGMAATNMALVTGTGVVMHEPIQALAPAIAVAGAFPFMLGGLFAEPQLKGQGDTSTVMATRPGPTQSDSGTIVTGIKNSNEMIISPDPEDTLNGITLKTNLQMQSNKITDTLGLPKPTVTITSDMDALQSYEVNSWSMSIHSDQPAEQVGETLVQENLNNFFQNGNIKIVDTSQLSPAMTKNLLTTGYTSPYEYTVPLSSFKEEGITFDLTSRIPSGNGGLYINSNGELTNVGSTESGLMRTGQYGSLEYRTVTTTPYQNGNVQDVGTGIARTITAEGTGVAPEQSIIFEGNMDVQRTITIEPTKLQSLFGIGPKVITQDFSIPTQGRLATLLADNPALVVSQPGGVETNPQLSDVYKVGGVQSSGSTALFHQSIATPQGQEWLGESGNAEGFALTGKTSNFILIEVGQSDALPSAEELLAGRPGELQASQWEGPKSSTERPYAPPEDLLPAPASLEAITSTEGSPQLGASPKGSPELGASGEVKPMTGADALTNGAPSTAPASLEAITSTEAPAELQASAEVKPTAGAAQIQTQMQKTYATMVPPVAQMPAVELEQGLSSGAGIDPAVIMGTAVQSSQSQTASAQLLTQSRGLAQSSGLRSQTGSTLVSSIQSVSKSVSLISQRQLSYLSSKTTQIFNTATSQKQNTSTSLKTLLSTLQTQKQTQKTTQKQVYGTLSTTVGFPNVGGIGITEPPAIAPSKLPHKKKTQSGSRKQNKPTIFDYMPDVSSSLLNLHGKKSRKRFYRGVGLSRPIL